jgi:hypothetical protein
MIEIFAVMVCVTHGGAPRCEIDKRDIFHSAEECEKARREWRKFQDVIIPGGGGAPPFVYKHSCVHKAVETWKPIE